LDAKIQTLIKTSKFLAGKWLKEDFKLFKLLNHEPRNAITVFVDESIGKIIDTYSGF